MRALTFAAPLATPEGDSPNGNTIDITGSDFWRFAGDLTVKYHIYFDQFLRQLGLTPTR
jgi:hypothetical protein